MDQELKVAQLNGLEKNLSSFTWQVKSHFSPVEVGLITKGTDLMKRNTIKRIVRQIQTAETAISEIDSELVQVIECNNDLDTVKMMDDLSELANRLLFVTDDGNKWASNKICREEHPNKLIWLDPITHDSYVP